MEADWEFEVGGDAPVIEACWEGFIDLRKTPERARQLPEAARRTLEHLDLVLLQKCEAVEPAHGVLIVVENGDFHGFRLYEWQMFNIFVINIQPGNR